MQPATREHLQTAAHVGAAFAFLNQPFAVKFGLLWDGLLVTALAFIAIHYLLKQPEKPPQGGDS